MKPNTTRALSLSRRSRLRSPHMRSTRTHSLGMPATLNCPSASMPTCASWRKPCGALISSSPLFSASLRRRALASSSRRSSSKRCLVRRCCCCARAILACAVAISSASLRSRSACSAFFCRIRSSSTDAFETSATRASSVRVARRRSLLTNELESAVRSGRGGGAGPAIRSGRGGGGSGAGVRSGRGGGATAGVRSGRGGGTTAGVRSGRGGGVGPVGREGRGGGPDCVG
mmetsp:Transcript_8396/g.21193  ORF Transcript_8396/g.21193 Transcript_8396/m.21193 type:complete len:230 (+) Transcript_8396:718-1407(+)